ncbi:MAG: formate dehydrogenase [Chloroflexus sp.]|uniref:FdhF/YdeP family oxidoreductase n=1 Tax=Chloroflexus sp. TaxID=1904827 RepID=UPI0021DC95F0|nr:FdhF/YdeP family oxidoreductase [Chloroflexus sp.]GIV90541.1 MAG: formate dehydrogenase [Chloroflexus sp.]
MKRRGWNPATWVSLVPNGLGQVKPNHYWEIVRTIWENRDNLGTAWRILHKGVCDGCALGTTGLRDFTMKGVHLCTVRLNLLRLNTMPPLDIRRLADVASLQLLNGRELRALGRLPYPLIRRRGEAGFRRITWDEALNEIAARIRTVDPRRIAFYLTSRGITNETYYVAQKVARFLGTNNVDNAARLCHAPSTTAMKQTLGVAASTCSYRDWIGTDVLVFIGSDAPNNQPVTTKYLYYAKQHGTRIVVVNPYREPGLERYWVPSVFESALFGTRLADRFFQIQTGGDIAFLNGTLKHLIERGWLDRAFIDAHTRDFDEVQAALATQSWTELEQASGATRAEMLAFAELLAHAKSAVFVWSMGITQHEYGVENVKAIINVALARGFIGREYCGVMPIRGHSGVQGGGEMGCTATTFPGGKPVNAEHARWLSEQWGFAVPDWKGLSCGEMIDAAYDGQLEVFYAVGGNFLDTMPDPAYIRTALSRPALRVHQDIVLSSQMLVDPADTVILLPAATRYEQRDGGTETSTEREIIFSPYITPPPAEARSEWEILMHVAERTYPERSRLIRFVDGQQIRDEIARIVPEYDGIQHLRKAGDHVQWGGRILCRGGVFATRDGRAQFTPLTPPDTNLPPGMFVLKTRRGKQFNSLIHDERDPLNGAHRDDVLINPDDAARLGVREGEWVVLRSAVGELRARIKFAPLKPGNVQVHWPEGNVLIDARRRDPGSGVPAYKAIVSIHPVEVPVTVE